MCAEYRTAEGAINTVIDNALVASTEVGALTYNVS